MALSFSQKVRDRFGSKAYRVYEVTHDGSATTIDASNLDMHHIEYAFLHPITALSSVADLPRLSGTTSGPFVTMVAMSSGSVNSIIAYGW